jgi:zinc transport system substrate-binding protein
MKRQWILPILLMLSIFEIPPPAGADEAIHVFVSIAPQKYFVHAIAGERAAVTVMVDPGRSPADYEPSPAQMTALSECDLYFAVGVPFESAWLPKFSRIHPAMKIIHTDAGIEKKPIDRYEIYGTGHNHGHGGHDHSPETMDPHIWLSPKLAAFQADLIRDGFIHLDPAHADFYRENHGRFLAEITALDAELTALFPDAVKGGKFLVFHPSWGYFADAYGLTQISIEIAGKEPKARDVQSLIEFSQKNQIRMIFIQPQFSVRQAEIIAKETGAVLVKADPLAENWPENLKTVASAIRQALQP